MQNLHSSSSRIDFLFADDYFYNGRVTHTQHHVKHHKVGKEEIASFMVYSMMNIDKNMCYTFRKMNATTRFFPFEYNLEKEIVLQDDRLVASSIDGELVVTISDAM